MTRKEIKLAICQVLIVTVSCFVAAPFPEEWFSAISYFGAVILVPLMSRNFVINFSLSLLHTLLLLTFIHLFGSVKGSVGGPVTDFLIPLLTIALYAAIYFGCVVLRKTRP